MYRKQLSQTVFLSVLFFLLAACTSTDFRSGSSGLGDRSGSAALPAPTEVSSQVSAETRPVEEQVLFQDFKAASTESNNNDAADDNNPTSSSSENREVTIGMMVIAPVPSLELVRNSFKQALADSGYIEGQNLTILDQHAGGDVAQLGVIAQEYVDKEVDLIVATTVHATVAAYNATKDMANPIPIVFNAVTNPYLDEFATSATEHSAWVVGHQIFPPLLATFETMRELDPNLSKVGIISDPKVTSTEVGESLLVAEQLDIEIILEQINDGSEVVAAAEALIAQDVDMLFYSLDTTVASQAEALVEVANQAQIPLISSVATSTQQGAAVSISPSVKENGYESGKLAVGVLNGTLDIGATRIERVRDFDVSINRDAAALQKLNLPEAFVSRAIDQTPAPAVTDVSADIEEAETEAEGNEGVTIGMAVIATAPPLELIRNEFKATLAAGGYIEGQNLTILDGNAEGNAANLAGIIQEFVDAEVDMIVTTSTPALQAAYAVVSEMDNPIPVVFNAVTSPYAIGVAESASEHPDWLIGSQLFPPLLASMETMKQVLPAAEQIGMIYDSGSANSVAQFEEIQLLAPSYDFELIAIGVTEESEVAAAAQSLADQGVDFLFTSQDILVGGAVGEIARIASVEKILFLSNVEDGAAISIVTNLLAAGTDSAEMALSILNGTEEISDMKIARVRDFDIIINRTALAAQGIELPDSILDRAIDRTPIEEPTSEADAESDE